MTPCSLGDGLLLLKYFLYISEGQDTFFGWITGLFIGWELGLFDVIFLSTQGQRSVPGTVQSLDQIHNQLLYR